MAESDDKKNELTESGRDGKSGKQKETNEKRCSLCGRPESEAGTLISMPNGMHICADCMEKGLSDMRKHFDIDSLLDGTQGMQFLNLGDLMHPESRAEK